MSRQSSDNAQPNPQNNQVPISFFVPFGTYLTTDQLGFTDAQAGAARPPNPADFVQAMQQQFDAANAMNQENRQSQVNGDENALPPQDHDNASPSNNPSNPPHVPRPNAQQSPTDTTRQDNANTMNGPPPNAFSIFPILPREGQPIIVGPDGWPLQQWIVFPPGVNPLSPPPNTQYYIFTTPMHPAFMPPPPKPKASKRTLESLPIVPLSSILPGEACPVCYEEFVPQRAMPTAVSAQPDDGSRPAKKKAISRGSPAPPDIIVRQMQPCNHLFCQTCLFEWLKQDTHCPMCRAEIIQDQDMSKGGFSMASGPRARSATSCDVQPASLCNHSGEESVQDDPITTLDTCHHRFHRSCLVTAARLQGLEENEQDVAMRCPCCRITNKVSLGAPNVQMLAPVELDVD